MELGQIMIHVPFHLIVVAINSGKNAWTLTQFCLKWQHTPSKF